MYVRCLIFKTNAYLKHSEAPLRSLNCHFQMQYQRRKRIFRYKNYVKFMKRDVGTQKGNFTEILGKNSIHVSLTDSEGSAWLRFQTRILLNIQLKYFEQSLFYIELLRKYKVVTRNMKRCTNIHYEITLEVKISYISPKHES